MALNVNNTGITSVIVNNTEMNVVKVVQGGVTTYIYGKPFTYTTGSKSGVASLVCTRAESPYAHASIGTVSNNGTIYYGDKIYFTPTASSGYTATTQYTSNNYLTVTGNITGVSYVSTTQNIPLSLELHVAFFLRAGSNINNSREQVDNASEYNGAKSMIPNFIVEDYLTVNNVNNEFIVSTSTLNNIVHGYNSAYRYIAGDLELNWTLADTNGIVYALVDVTYS